MPGGDLGSQAPRANKLAAFIIEYPAGADGEAGLVLLRYPRNVPPILSTNFCTH